MNTHKALSLCNMECINKFTYGTKKTPKNQPIFTFMGLLSKYIAFILT